MARVYIVCPYFNSARFLAESVESVLAQSFDDWKLLLIDDGSTDSSAAIAEQYARRYRRRIVLLQHADRQNQGISASRNLGLKTARGEFLAFLDSDDVWHPNMLQTQVANLEQHPTAVMTFAAAERWYQWPGNQNGSTADFIVPASFSLESNLPISPPHLLSAFVADESKAPCPSTVLVRRAAAVRCGGFVEEFRGLYDDQVFYARLCATRPVYAESACLARYRQHAASCCAYAGRMGIEVEERVRFLNWLTDFLTAQKISDSHLPQIVRQEREQIALAVQ